MPVINMHSFKRYKKAKLGLSQILLKWTTLASDSPGLKRLVSNPPKLNRWTGLVSNSSFLTKIGCLKEKAMKKRTAWKLNRETSSYWHCVVCQPVGSGHLSLHWRTKVHRLLFHLACRLSIFVKREWWITRNGERRNCLEALVSSNIVLLFY